MKVSAAKFRVSFTVVEFEGKTFFIFCPVFDFIVALIVSMIKKQ